MNNTIQKTNIQAEQNKVVHTDVEIYAALLFIKYLYKNGKIKEHVYKNILNDYKNSIDISNF